MSKITTRQVSVSQLQTLPRRDIVPVVGLFKAKAMSTQAPRNAAEEDLAALAPERGPHSEMDAQVALSRAA